MSQPQGGGRARGAIAVVGAIVMIIAIRVSVNVVDRAFGLIGLLAVILVSGGVWFALKKKRENEQTAAPMYTPPGYTPAPSPYDQANTPVHGYPAPVGSFPPPTGAPDQGYLPPPSGPAAPGGAQGFAPQGYPAPQPQPGYPAPNQPGYAAQPSNPYAPQGYPPPSGGYQQPGHPQQGGYQQPPNYPQPHQR
ncbi:hypothetical protein ACFXG4_00645 [Nocardia sp. NPDC059246]|uniref:hypothetical protein n=1 Tax=unclassified Nocardia TaxID=2637762 RepID=UPI00369054C8